MLRKSHSTEWAGPSSERSESAIHTIALQQHFEEMKGDLRNFGDIFTQWVSSRRQALTTDKEEYLRTLAQEQGINYLNKVYNWPPRCGGGDEEAVNGTSCT